MKGLVVVSIPGTLTVSPPSVLTTAVAVDETYDNTNQVMKFVVSSTPVTDTSNVPAKLRTVPFPPAGHTDIDHQFRFHRSGGEWKINDVGFSDAANRVLAKVPQGKVEIWQLENKSGVTIQSVSDYIEDVLTLLSGMDPSNPCTPSRLQSHST